MKRVVLLAAALLLGGRAAADSLATCTVSATPVSFGTYDPLSTSANTSTGVVTASCGLIAGISLFVSYNIQLSAGSGSFTGRTLKSGSNSLTYNLFTDNTYGTVWGDGSGTTMRISDSYLLGVGGAIKNYTAYGKATAMQNVSAGMYVDTIIVTITY